MIPISPQTLGFAIFELGCCLEADYGEEAWAYLGVFTEKLLQGTGVEGEVALWVQGCMDLCPDIAPVLAESTLYAATRKHFETFNELNELGRDYTS